MIWNTPLGTSWRDIEGEPMPLCDKCGCEHNDEYRDGLCEECRTDNQDDD